MYSGRDAVLSVFLLYHLFLCVSAPHPAAAAAVYLPRLPDIKLTMLESTADKAQNEGQ